MTPEQIVDRQLEFYNARNLEDFVSTYAPDIQIYFLGHGEPYVEGHEQLAQAYGKLFENQGLHVTILKRVVLGNRVIDEELVTRDNVPDLHAVAIYEVSGELIQKVWLIK